MAFLRASLNTNFSHGHSKTLAYYSWKTMHQRCENKNNSSYKNYGGREITVCKRWKDYSKFLIDMGKRPPGMSIERVDNDGNYTPKNCKWILKGQQRINSRRTHLLEFNGKLQPLKYWAKHVGISIPAMRRRVEKYGIATAVNMPVEKWRVESGHASVRAQGRDSFIKRSIIRWKTNPKKSISPL